MKKKPLMLLSIGVLNLIHGGVHIIQFIQSMFLVAHSLEEHHHHHHHEESLLSSIMHSPILAVVWAVIGILTMWIGWQDYKHHKQHKH